MEYKYKKNQFFGKKIEAPDNVLQSIYANRLSIEDYLRYNLIDKVPSSCLKEEDLRLLERFGVQKLTTLDFELVNRLSHRLKMKDLLMKIEPTVEDINLIMYEAVKDSVAPSEYSTRMKQVYSNRLFDINESELTSTENQVDYDINYLKLAFNRGMIRILEIIKNWELFKDKDISYCLKKDSENIYNITDEQLKVFMSEYGLIIEFILEQEKDIYKVIYNIYGLEKTEEEKNEYLKKLSENILYKASGINKLTNEQLKVLFSNTSLETYLSQYNEYAVERIFNELETLEEDYIYNIQIPISKFMEFDVLAFVGTYGLKNVIDFDNEHNNFFTRDDFKMLKLITPAYLRYTTNIREPEMKFLFKKQNDSSYNFYTKEEFYEALRRMIIYGPTDKNYVENAIDMHNVEGEFRNLNQDLFIIDEAPEELKQLFYGKKITPTALVTHPDYIPYLKDKNLACCFEDVEVLIIGNNYYQFKNIYQYLVEQSDFRTAMSVILQYAGVFEVIFSDDSERLKLLSSDHFMRNLKRFNDSFKKNIIEKNKIYPTRIPTNLKTAYPDMFLNDEAPEELKNLFNNRKLTAGYILEHPEYERYLRNVDLECLYPYIKVVVTKQNKSEIINLVEVIKKLYGKEAFDMMLTYGDLLLSLYNRPEFSLLHFNGDITKEDIEETLNSEIITAILNGEIKYNENFPEKIKTLLPELFLPEDAPDELKQKFYNRELIMSDFNNPDINKYFINTNITCGIDLKYSWLISLFNEYPVNEANEYRKRLYDSYIKIDDSELQTLFKDFIKQSSNNLAVDKIDKISEVLQRVSYSNSSEMYNFRHTLSLKILNTADPFVTLKRVEDIFLKNHLPTIGKIYSVFEHLHPGLEDFDFSEDAKTSPILKKKSADSRSTTIFSDLVKASFGSNNRSIRNYLENIELGYSLYLNVMSGNVIYEELSDSDKNELNQFRNYLTTLYNNMQNRENENTTLEITNNVMDDITRLYALFSEDGRAHYNLADRAVSILTHFAGIDTLEEAYGYFNSKVSSAERKNRITEEHGINIESGDFVKGIGGLEHFSSILQNGILAKEFLGASATSDHTPLDTDLSMILEPKDNIADTLRSTAAFKYEPILFVFKHDKFNITRTADLDNIDSGDITRPEAFYVGRCDTDNSHHYGVRTGFASTEIDYILIDKYDEKIGLEIALNGFYIPVYDYNGNILFTSEDYDLLRTKMSGLKYYSSEKFAISDNLNIPGVEKYIDTLSEKEAINRRNKKTIEDIIGNVLAEVGLELKNRIDKDLSPKSVELIGTGSSERNTDLMGTADVDFIMRIDRYFVNNQKELDKIRKAISVRFGNDVNVAVNSDGDLNLKDIVIDGTGTPIDIDISFAKKTDEVSYSTEMCLNDRINTIRTQEPTLYSYVISNIILAKQILKEAEAYKPNRGVNPQGGLGGVGIENWILQHGGSFMDAAISFVEASRDKSFEEFKDTYQIWDFGENHLALRKGIYIHDNFVKNNMSEQGYIKMREALIQYLNKYNLYNKTK